jgi:hypothetical protein
MSSGFVYLLDELNRGFGLPIDDITLIYHDMDRDLTRINFHQNGVDDFVYTKMSVMGAIAAINRTVIDISSACAERLDHQRK